VDWARRDAPVIAALTTLVAAKPRWGYWKCCDRLRLDGHGWNHKRLWRVYCRLRLNLSRRTKKRLPLRPAQPLVVLPQPNEVWALDFMSDTLYGGRRFRTPNLLDEGVREVLAIEVDTALPAERVIRVLEQVVGWRGQPRALRLDNGPELLANRFVTWCADRTIALRYIQPGKPNQNAFIERFNRTYRHEVLDAYVFESLAQVRELSAQWMREYNKERPHDALARVPPATYRAQLINAGTSPLSLSRDGEAYGRAWLGARSRAPLGNSSLNSESANARKKGTTKCRILPMLSVQIQIANLNRYTLGKSVMEVLLAEILIGS
jgi:putative transposase